MSKQVTIMTWALHKFTHCSKAAVACSRAARYSADSGSSSGSTSTGEEQQAAGHAWGDPTEPRTCFSPLPTFGSIWAKVKESKQLEL